MNKKNAIIISLLLFIGGGIMIGLYWQHMSTASEEKVGKVHEKNEREIEQKDAPMQVVSNTDPFDTMSAYIEEGEECKEI